MISSPLSAHGVVSQLCALVHALPHVRDAVPFTLPHPPGFMHYLELALSVLSGALLPQIPWIILAWAAFDPFAGISLPGLAWRAQGQSLLSAFVA